MCRLPTPCVCYSTPTIDQDQDVNTNATNIHRKRYRYHSSSAKDGSGGLSIKKQRQLYPDYNCHLHTTIPIVEDMNDGDCVGVGNTNIYTNSQTHISHIRNHNRVVLAATAADPFTFTLSIINHCRSTSVDVDGSSINTGGTTSRTIPILSTILPHYSRQYRSGSDSY